MTIPKATIGRVLPDIFYEDPDGSVWSRSEVLNFDFHWDGEQFDIRDPLTDRTIHPVEMERQARVEAENQARRLMEENERLRRQQPDS